MSKHLRDSPCQPGRSLNPNRVPLSDREMWQAAQLKALATQRTETVALPHDSTKAVNTVSVTRFQA